MIVLIIIIIIIIIIIKVVLAFETVDEILKCDMSNYRYWTVLSCGAVYYSAPGGTNI